jgi:hypothetical protein
MVFKYAWLPHTLTLPCSWIELPLYTRTRLILTFVVMDNAGSTSANVESLTLVDYLEEGGFPALLWDTLRSFGYTTYPEYSTREIMNTGQLLRCEVKVKISACPTNPAWDEWECMAH